MSFSRSLKNDIHRQDTIIGLFVLLALALVIYLLLHQNYLGSRKGQWIALHSELPNSFGLAPGTLIELSGVTIGNVEEVTLREDAQVAVSVLIDNQYQNLLRGGSYLTISSAIGIDTVLSGVRMELVPGGGEFLLASDGRINIVPPQSFDEILEKLNLEDVAAQVQHILTSVETIMAGLADSSADIQATLKNVSSMTAELEQELPGTLQNINTLLQTTTSGVQEAESQIAAISSPAISLLGTAENAFATADSAINTSNQILLDLQPSLQRLPGTVDTVDQLLVSLDRLTRQLSKHWLLGGDRGKSDGTITDTIVLLPDDDLYTTD